MGWPSEVYRTARARGPEMNATKLAELAARIAVQLTRETSADLQPSSFIARDALDLAKAGLMARHRIAAKQCPQKHFEAANKILARYDAETIPQGELEGMVLGAR